MRWLIVIPMRVLNKFSQLIFGLLLSMVRSQPGITCVDSPSSTYCPQDGSGYTWFFHFAALFQYHSSIIGQSPWVERLERLWQAIVQTIVMSTTLRTIRSLGLLRTYFLQPRCTIQRTRWHSTRLGQIFYVFVYFFLFFNFLIGAQLVHYMMVLCCILRTVVQTMVTFLKW